MADTALLTGSEGITGLDADEYKMLHNCLQLIWSDSSSRQEIGFRNALRTYEKHEKYVPPENGFLGPLLVSIMQHLGEDSEEVRGILCSSWLDEPMQLLREDEGEEEYKALVRLLNALRSGDWFAEFLSKELERYDKGQTHVSPSEVLTNLSAFIGPFQDRIEDAKHLLKAYPELLGAQPTDDVLEVSSATQK